MKLTLILMRHGEAESATAAESDFHRSLTPRGNIQAGRVAQQLLDQNLTIDKGLFSPAQRALQTATAVENSGLGSGKWESREALYGARVSQVTGEIADRDPPPDATVAVVAHNPAVSDVVTALAGHPVALSVAEAALLELESASGWGEGVQMTHCWELVQVFNPWS